MNCRTIEPLLSALALNELAPDRAEQVRSHLASCNECKALYHELDDTISKLRNALADRSTATPTLDEQRRKRVFQEAARKRAARQSFWRVLTRTAACLTIAGGLSFLLLPRLYRVRSDARTKRSNTRKHDMLADISAMQQSATPAAPAPAPSMPPAASRQSNTATPAVSMPMELADERTAAGLKEKTRAIQDQAIQTSPLPTPSHTPSPVAVALDQTPPKNEFAAQASKGSDPTPSADKQERGRSVQPLSQASSKTAVARPAALPRSKPTTAPRPRTLQLPGLAAKPADLGVIREILNRGERPPAAQIRVEEFLAMFAYGLSSPTDRVIAVSAEGSPSPFRPDLHLLMLNLSAGATNPANANAVNEANIRVSFNPERVKRFRILGYDHKPLQHLPSPEIILATASIPSGSHAALLFELELQGDKTLPLGKIHIHALDAGSGENISSTTPLERSLLKPAPARATPGFRLAAATAEFAEQLKTGSSDQKSLEPVIRLLQRAALEFSLDANVRDLADLATKLRSGVLPDL